jgi:hypothetical protein
MPQLQGFEQVYDVLGNLTTQAAKMTEATYSVGYSADYAVHVHEDLQRVHPNGQAKFLETPATLLQPVLANMVAGALQQGRTLQQALELAGNYLLIESKKLVPVQTGFLRDSGYVDVS